MSCYKLGALAPQIHDSAFIAAEATVIGQAVLSANTSVWPCAVIRADNEPIVVGQGSIIQEGAVLHVDPGCPLTIGQDRSEERRGGKGWVSTCRSRGSQ